jgi:hypothetical protein
MQNSTCNFAKLGLTALMAFGSITAVSPAVALQADATVDQVASPSAKSGWLVDQIGSAVPASSDLAQVQAPAINPAVSFQANVDSSNTQLTMADQLSGYADSYGAPVELAFLGYGLNLGHFIRVGQGTSFASDDAGNSQQHAWNGMENLQASLQRGIENRSIQDQVGIRNVSLIVQDGEANFAETTQSAQLTLASILQIGSRNSASIYQGSDNGFALISQSGAGNIASIRQ